MVVTPEGIEKIRNHFKAVETDAVFEPVLKVDWKAGENPFEAGQVVKGLRSLTRRPIKQISPSRNREFSFAPFRSTRHSSVPQIRLLMVGGSRLFSLTFFQDF